MQFQTRTRNGLQRLHGSWTSLGLPVGAFPLAIATLVLIGVPIARAADGTPTPASGSASVPALAVESARSPQVTAELVRSRSISGRAVTATGKVAHTGRGKAHVRFAVRAAGSRAWKTVDTDNVRAGKKFKLSWKGGRPGRYMTRVSVRKFGQSDTDRTGRAWVFRRSFASYYGPGLYGGGLACGGRLSPSTIGVAHKTLPCGTKVTFTLGNGRVVTAPVIDRGPFVAGRDWDLTSGLKHKLGFGSTGVVYTTR